LNRSESQNPLENEAKMLRMTRTIIYDTKKNLRSEYFCLTNDKTVIIPFNYVNIRNINSDDEMIKLPEGSDAKLRVSNRCGQTVVLQDVKQFSKLFCFRADNSDNLKNCPTGCKTIFQIVFRERRGSRLQPHPAANPENYFSIQRRHL